MKKHLHNYDFNKRGILLLLLPSEKTIPQPVKRKQTFIGKKLNDTLLHYLLTHVTIDNSMSIFLDGDMLACRFHAPEYGYRIAIFPGLDRFRQRHTYRTIVVALTDIVLKEVRFYFNDQGTLRELPLRLLRSKSILGRLTTKANPCAIWLRPNVRIRPSIKGYYLKPFNVTGIPELAKLIPKKSLH